MNQNNNKDLYQILRIEKSASQELVIQKCKDLVKKDVADEIGIAALVLSNPQKRKEYDRVGWKEEWKEEWEEQNAFRHSVFQAIMNHKKSLNDQGEKTPDGFKVYVFIHEDLDPSLWTPYKGLGGWIDKIFGIFDSRDDNKGWKDELEDYKNKMINALDQAYEENKKNPINKGYWERVDRGSCAKCGKPAKLRCNSKYSDGKEYCSPECYDDNWDARYEKPEYKSPKTPLSPDRVPNEKDTSYCVYCQKKNGQETWDWDNTKTGKCEKYCSYACREKASAEYCDNCQKQIERYREGHAEVSRGIFTMDSNHQRRVFCWEDCEKKWQQKPGNKIGITKLTKLGEFLAERKGNPEYKTNWITGKTTKANKQKNIILELFNWMKKEGIINISLNSSGNLVIEYSGSQAQVVNDSDLTNEQKEIKEFFQQVKEQGGDTYLNQKELENFVNQENNEEKQKNNNGLMPVVIIGVGVIILILFGVIIYKNKKKGY